MGSYDRQGRAVTTANSLSIANDKSGRATMPGKDKLKRIQIRGFRSLADVEIEMRPINVLVGPNGAGKSNLLAVFDLLGEIVEGRLQSAVAAAGGPDRLLHNGQRHTQSIDLDLAFPSSRTEVENGYSAKLGLALDHLVLNEESWSLWIQSEEDEAALDNRGAHVTSQKGVRESRLADGDHRDDPLRAVLSTWRRFHFHDTSDAASAKGLGEVGDNRQLRRDGANLAAMLLRLKQTDLAAYTRIVGAIRAVAPFFDDFDLQPAAENPLLIRLEWRERGSDSCRDGHSLSDGTLRFICLATLLLQPQLPNLIVIDEPELGLHPAAIVQFADMVRAASASSQVLIATQSVTMLNQFETEDVIVVEHEGGQSTFRRLSDEGIGDWLEAYALGEVWEKNLIGGRPR